MPSPDQYSDFIAVWDYGNVEGNPNWALPNWKLLDEDRIKQIVHLYYMTPSLLLDEVKEWIQVTHDIPISCSEVC